MKTLPIALLSLALLSGCATISKEECLNGSWREIGQRDGQNGRTADYIVNHAKACQKVGVLPDRAEWERGRQAGLPAYCNVPRVYREGRNGRRLSPVCPANLVPVLSRANARGLRYHELTAEIAEMQRDINELERIAVRSNDRSVRARALTRINLLNSRILMTRARRNAVARP